MAAKRGNRKPTRKTKARSGGLLPWIAGATVLVIVGYDHWPALKPELAGIVQATAAAPPVRLAAAAVPAPLAKPLPTAIREEGLPVPPASIPVGMPIPTPAALPARATANASVSESFGLCGQGTHINCVFDGSTFWVRGEKIRIADIETPALGPSRCPEEERRANAAKLRLLSLLNAGPFTLQAGTPGDAGGEPQRRILRGGQSFGDLLVGEGLAHRRMDHALSWCA